VIDVLVAFSPLLAFVALLAVGACTAHTDTGRS
jgi:hypothetical protein